MRKYILLVLLLILIAPVNSYATWSLSSTRGYTWTGNVGVEGDIPTRETVCTTLGTAGQVPSYAQSVTSAQIQTALNNCASGQVVYLNVGTYTFTSTVSIPSNKTLRGAGMDQTILQGVGSSGSMPSGTPMIDFSSGYTDRDASTASNITDTYSLGATSITLADASAFPTSGYIFVDELNDTNIPVVAGTWGCGIYNDPDDGRNWAVMHKITGKVGNVISIDPPAVYSFASAFTPQAIKVLTTTVESAGVENLTLNNSTSNANWGGVAFQGSANCWAYKIKVIKYGRHGMSIWYDSFRNTIRQCYFTDAVDHANSDHYALAVYQVASFNLIESNVFYNVTNGVVLQSNTGNVIAYNYFNNVHRTEQLGEWFWSDNWTHSSFVAKTLWEGNYGQGLVWDNVDHGNGFNTSFRNRWTGYDESGLQTDVSNSSTIKTMDDSYYTNIIGNVLGKASYTDYYENATGAANTALYNIGYNAGAQWTTQYRHRNYNYVTTTIKDCGTAGEPGCFTESTDTVLPDSLYLSSKPAWFGDQTWPPVDPTSPTLTTANKIPAQVFYDTGSWPSATADETAPELSTATANDTLLILNWTEACYQGTGYNDNQLDVDGITGGDNVAITYVSGDGTDQWIYTLATGAQPGDTLNIDFDGTVDSIEDGSGNDLTAIVNGSVANYTSLPPPSSSFGGFSGSGFSTN